MIFLILILLIAIGALSIRLIVRNQIPYLLQWSLGTCLGFGFAGIFVYVHMLLLGLHHRSITIIVSSLVFLALLWINYKLKFKPAPALGSRLDNIIVVGSCLLIAIPLIAQATYFPLGGWDAWSCWNLKAKFIFLGQENFKDMFVPELWRSNTQYPLLLPSIIAFGWQWIGNADSSWPMLCTLVFSLSIALVLISTLLYSGINVLFCVFLSFLILATPFCTTLAISQYSDILVGLLILCIFACWVLRKKQSSLLWLIPLFLGFLSFAKTEGLVACGLITLLFLIADHQIRNWKWIGAVVVCLVPTVIFILSMAPANEAFINGFLSSDKPSSLQRLYAILTYFPLELMSFKWQGVWVLIFLGLMINAKRAFSKPLHLIGIFMIIFIGIVMTYYWVNTFFEINWWLNTTLHRILFALLPTCALWIGLAGEKK